MSYTVHESECGTTLVRLGPRDWVQADYDDRNGNWVSYDLSCQYLREQGMGVTRRNIERMAADLRHYTGPADYARRNGR